MVFKKLEVYGFKSFADKLTVEFNDGITGIVGPNGCGKSNVADSIRWALGEQSAKTLRGSQMLDVIFNGTERRKSLSYCEVLLYFDNTSRIFDADYNELVISRKLYRNGESEYSINKQVCRLKDITHILHNSGLGRDGYSIIGQGRIDEILSAKAEDRRAIFEDAAGISKYKHTKVENERKLERVMEKLSRVGDIVNELEKQLGPLERQAEAAKKCFQLKDALRTVEVNNYLHQYETAGEKKKAVNFKIEGLTQEIAVKESEFEKVKQIYSEAVETVANVDQSIKELNAVHLNLTVNLEKKAGEEKVLKVKLASLREQNEKLSADIKRFDEEYQNLTKDLSQASEVKSSKQQNVIILKSRVDDLSNRYLAVAEMLAKNEGESESAHKQIIDAMGRLTEIKSKMSGLLSEKKALEDKIGDFSSRLDQIKAQSAAEKGNNNLLKIEHTQNTSKREAVKQKSDMLTNSYNESLFNLRNTAVQIDKASENYHKLSARLKLLQDMSKEMNGYQYAVKKLISDSRENAALSSKIEGVVATLIKVDQRLETAIEMALGTSIQNIVTPTEDDAKFLVEYLKTSQYGRATFLPLTAVKARQLENEYSFLLRYDGCLGIASDLINYNPKYDTVFKGLLGKTIIADNIDTAVRMARDAKFNVKIVTLEGDIIAPGGAITGGSKKQVSNILSMEREAEQVSEQVKALESQLATLNSNRETAVKRQDELIEEIKTLNDSRQALDIVLATLNEKTIKSNSTIEQLRDSGFELDSLSNKTFQRIAEIEDEIKSADELEALINSRKTVANSSNEQNQKQFDVLRKDRDELHVHLTDAKVELSSTETSLEGIENEIGRIKSSILSVLSLIDDSKNQIERNNGAIRNIELEPLQADDFDEAEARQKLKETITKLSDLDAFKTEKQNEMYRLDELRQVEMQRLATLNELKVKEESELVQIDSILEFYTQRITEEYELDYESCQVYRVADFDVKQGNAEANRLKREIGRMGNVNMSAVEDYETLKARYEIESAAKIDLEKSIEDIRLVIKDMTKEMLTRFNKQFDIIKENFKVCFKALFGGGNADLILEEAEDPLSAGIEIVAEPPGKKLQSISLLSGGERALTAIAILFAILRMKPMPFCVLDEIEAALDDANAERFATYLHNFSKKTQFIVITHRKPTMEKADSLYGVTMEEKGVSKIVSVKLSDAVKVIEN